MCNTVTPFTTELALTVIVWLPGGVLALEVRVTVKVAVPFGPRMMLTGLKLVEMPAGDEAAVRLTVPEKPLKAAILTVEVLENCLGVGNWNVVGFTTSPNSAERLAITTAP